jgi:hypothetical protein
MTTDLKRLKKCRSNSAGKNLSVVRLSNAKLDDGELIPTQTRHRVPLAHARCQPIGRGHQKSIADGMAQCVVDQLEVVQIETHHREFGSPTGHGDGLFYTLLEQHTVGQLGQCVMAGHKHDACLGLLPLGDVPIDSDHPRCGTVP